MSIKFEILQQIQPFCNYIIHPDNEPCLLAFDYIWDDLPKKINFIYLNRKNITGITIEYKWK